MIQQLEKLLAQGRDSALLRFGLASAYLQQNNLDQALFHAHKMMELDPSYSAGWKLYGKILVARKEIAAAKSAYEQGIKTATQQGDLQLVKEMQVFLKRLIIKHEDH